MTDDLVGKYLNQDYEKIKNELKQKKQLFIDNMFPPNENISVYSSQTKSRTKLKWLRPPEICKLNRFKAPKFIVNKIEPNDISQGAIGNCWFIAGLVAVTTYKNLIDNILVKSSDYSFDGPNYCGIFCFRFWLFGKWYEVVIDDFLPVHTYNNRLVFVSNKNEPNEFWAPLVEKAYAKINGNYHNLSGGYTIDALVDLSGGIDEIYEIDTKDRNSINYGWELLQKAKTMGSMCGTSFSTGVSEEKIANGLVGGHAYTILDSFIVAKNKIRLVCLRNPWGQSEWSGAWSDKSSNWNTQITHEEKTKINFQIEEDGIFWMDYDKDFIKFFKRITFCHLTPNSATSFNTSWTLLTYHDKWSIKDGTAVGHDYGYTNRNPQMCFELDSPSTCLIQLMVKYTREMSTVSGKYIDMCIFFTVFKLKNQSSINSIRQGYRVNMKDLIMVGTCEYYSFERQITTRFKLDKGVYVLIANTRYPKEEGSFLFRIFIDNKIHQSKRQTFKLDKMPPLQKALPNVDIENDNDSENEQNVKKSKKKHMKIQKREKCILM